MYCAKCGTQLPDDANFCMKCGTQISGSKKLPEKFEFREEFVDLRHLGIHLLSRNKPHQDAAWQASSPTVLEVISKLGNQGWELVEQHVGYNLLVTEDAGTSAKGCLMNFIAGTTESDSRAIRVVGARLHFRKISE